MKEWFYKENSKQNIRISPLSATNMWSEFVKKEIQFDVKGGISMTSNQIAYANYEEARRHNQAYEAETAIHNRATESEDSRHNRESESIGWQQTRVGMQQAAASMYGAQASMAHARAASLSAQASLIGANANMYNVVASNQLRSQELDEQIRHSMVSESTEQSRTKAYGVSVLGGTFRDVTSGLVNIADMYNKVRRGY